MKPELVDYKPEHAIRILEEYARSEETILLAGQDPEGFVTNHQLSGPAWTLLLGDRPIGCGGIIICAWHNGLAWLLLSKLFYSNIRTTVKLIRQYLETTAEKHELVRVELETVASSATNARFAEWLGFELEGLKRSYGPNGEDFFLFGRIF